MNVRLEGDRGAKTIRIAAVTGIPSTSPIAREKRAWLERRDMLAATSPHYRDWVSDYDWATISLMAALRPRLPRTQGEGLG